jgi:hypothetical protein
VGWTAGGGEWAMTERVSFGFEYLFVKRIEFAPDGNLHYRQRQPKALTIWTMAET